MPPRWSTGCRPRGRSSSLSQIICWFDQGAMLPRAEVERTMRRFAERGDAEARLTVLPVQIAPDSPKLAVVMVGLPARGKSYIARRIERYLSWLGYRTGVFNVGEYRRARVGAQHAARASSIPTTRRAKRRAGRSAMAALDDMVAWLTDGGQVAIYDATNSTRARRAMVRARCERAGFQVLFIEIRCDDPHIIEANIREHQAVVARLRRHRSRRRP